LGLDRVFVCELRVALVLWRLNYFLSSFSTMGGISIIIIFNGKLRRI
jgi:hypothetical protein